MTLAGRLTDFQKLMRSWKELAPYNAAHVLRMAGAADADSWADALTTVSKQVDASAERLRVETTDDDLDATIARELNRPFDDGEPPLRAVVVASGNNDHHLALTYDHWFADSPSIRALMERAFHLYRHATGDLPPLRTSNSATSADASIFTALAGGLRTYRRHRRACRIHLRDPLDFRTGFFSRHFPAGVINGIRAISRQHGAKVNDVFLAAAAHVLGEHTAQQRAAAQSRFLRPRRDRVAVASAIDLRDNADATFGFSVSYYTVVVEHPDEIALRDLLSVVTRQTTTAKASDSIAEFDRSLKCARYAWLLTSSRESRAELFRKGAPLVAGISNVNLSGSWVERATEIPQEPRLLDYLRVSPVGPLLPLVFTLTTIGDRLSLCVSFRTTAFAANVAIALADAFMSKLIAFSEAAI